MINKNRLLIFLLLLLPLYMTAKDNEEFFAKVQNNKDGKVIRDDSTIVTIQLFSSRPFADIKCTTKDISIRGCVVHKVYSGSTGRQAITYINQRPYYTMVWAQYSVQGNKKGQYTFPALSFSATLYVQQRTQSDDPFDPFGFFEQPTYKKISKTTQSTTLKLEVTDAPKKSTQELIHSGRTVM